MKKKTIAALLAFFFGPIGLHKFYLRDVGSGIFYIVLTYMLMGWFRIPVTAFLGYIDAIKLLSMSDEEFDRKYNRYTRTRSGRLKRTTPEKTQSNNKGQYTYKTKKSRNRKNPFKTSAQKKYEDFDLEEAIKDYEQALVISPDDPEVHFNMAAIYSLQENKDKSYFHLQRANETGYSKMDEVMTKDDFAYIRIQKDFDTFRSANFSLEKQKTLDAPKEDLLQGDMLLSQLNKLKKLREKGLLSEKEFLYEKEKLLKR